MREVPSPGDSIPARTGPAPEEAVLSRLRAELSQAVARVCPFWMAAEREDIVQLAVLRVMDAAAGREGDRPFPSSYLRKVAYSVTVDEIRKFRRRRETSMEEQTAADPGEPSREDPDPERASTGHEIGAAIRSCLARLIRPRRLAVTLYLQDHTVPELSRLLGWSPKKGENLVYRGLADLRQCLTAKGVRP